MELPLVHDLHDAAVAAGTAGRDDFRAFHDVPEEVIEGARELGGFRMVRFAEFLGFPVVAATAVSWRDQRGNQKAFMVIRIRLALLSAMALHAADALRRMAADFPIVDAADG